MALYVLNEKAKVIDEKKRYLVLACLRLRKYKNSSNPKRKKQKLIFVSLLMRERKILQGEMANKNTVRSAIKSFILMWKNVSFLLFSINNSFTSKNNIPKDTKDKTAAGSLTLNVLKLNSIIKGTVR